MQRSRSLRKPGGGDPQQQRGTEQQAGPGPDPRTLSPSRLPVKPPSRIASVSSGVPRQQAALGRTATGSSLARSTASTRAARDEEPKKYPPSSSSLRTVSTSAAGKVTRARSKTTVGSSAAGPAGSGPGAAGGAGVGTARTGSATGHARTRSSATVLTGATTLRPPSQTSKPQPPPQPSSGPAAPPPQRMGHTRTKSAAAAGAEIPRPPSESSKMQPPRQASSSTTAAPRASANANRGPLPLPPHAKPSFSALQQHYSPAKSTAPKPLTSTFLAPPSPGKLPSNVVISADTLRLQNDLLRHHVLHASECEATASWHASAQGRLGGRFEDLARESRELSREETRLLEAVNVLALRAWGGNLEERVQGLDAVLSPLWRLSEAGGKHARLARRFERWAERAVELEDARERGGGGMLDGGDEPALVGELDAAWKQECEGLRRKLEAWAAQIEGLALLSRPDGPEVGSNLEGILRGCGELVGGMLSELGLMLEIEKGLVAREREWARGVIESVGDEGTGAGAIWRSL
ncbi:uncharacterized protein DNG_03282 [Cephalotrichum gorgonifer]|uniref:Uncharacterized protein n=1 Tax=Cephalotrichum gorgonifer TaxID=2041049 RepID=A0AAE8MWS5_9PEZI|nr:uncharacterized protein DNG_03282 [Cephalotrichum gorgonifer]